MKTIEELTITLTNMEIYLDRQEALMLHYESVVKNVKEDIILHKKELQKALNDIKKD